MNKRLAIIGCGDHAERGHVDSLLALGRSIDALVDPNVAAREKMQATLPHTAQHFESLEKFQAGNIKIDGWVICSPDRFHLDTLQAAIEAGVHVLVDKPLATELGEVERLRTALQRGKDMGLAISACHPRRHDPPYLWLKETLKTWAPRLGGVVHVDTEFYYHSPSKHDLHHGLLIDHINHEIDIVSWLLGFSHIKAHKLYDSETRYSAAGVRDDGISFCFVGSRHLDCSVYGESMRIRCRSGEIHIDTHTGSARILDHNQARYRETVLLGKCGVTDYVKRFADLNKAWIGYMNGGEAPYTIEQMMLNTEMGIYLTHDGHYSSHSS